MLKGSVTTTQAGKRKSKFDWATYVEEFYAESKVSRGAALEYLTRTDFIDHWMKKKKVSEEQATEAWEKRSLNPDVYGYEWDYGGEENELRLLVKMRDYVSHLAWQ